jgi:hypothetical protein
LFSLVYDSLRCSDHVTGTMDRGWIYGADTAELIDKLI